MRGFSLAEIMIVLAILSVITVAAAPYFIGYWRAAATRSAARELTAALNRARQLAITTNGLVCILTDNNARVRFEQGGCGTNNWWRAAGTDSQGWMSLPNNIRITGPNPNVVFTNLGGAVPAGQFRLTNPVDNQSVTVTVAASGRITTP